MKHLACGALALVLAAPIFASMDGPRQCASLVRLTDISQAVEPGIYVEATDELPAHCRVRGVINRAIRFEVTLPEDWNGRFMFTAVGGAAGVIGDVTSLLPQGFAMASTDTGHEAVDGNAYLTQPEALLDYAYRGVHLSTQAAKAIVSHYYGRDIDYAYLQGCSNGGRAAMLEAFHFPTDYDGIIAGAPAFRFLEFMPWAVTMDRAQRAAPLTDESLVLLDNASRQACDLLDGIEDGVIGDPMQCDPETFLPGLACAEGESEGCLTAGQIDTARTVYADLVDADGNVVSPGVPPGAEAAGDWHAWLLPNEELAGGNSIVGLVGEMLSLLMREDPTFDLAEFDPTDQARIAAVVSPLDVPSGDLGEFRANGGKLLMYQGWNDVPLRPQRALSYLADVERHAGGADEAADFFRLFMAPGMVHCAGGPGAWQADYVEPIVRWREEGIAPERILATQPGPVAMAHIRPDDRVGQSRRFTRPMCPHPQVAQHDGNGDVDDAGSFNCANPK